jgi:hypothetical protein
MDVLCTDKTRTLTVGVLDLDGAWDAQGAPSRDVERLAVENARLQTGLPSPLDDALVAHAVSKGIAPSTTKLDEIPYDFVRKRMTWFARADVGAARMKAPWRMCWRVAIAARSRASRRSTVRRRRSTRFARWSGRPSASLAGAAWRSRAGALRQGTNRPACGVSPSRTRSESARDTSRARALGVR